MSANDYHVDGNGHLQGGLGADEPSEEMKKGLLRASMDRIAAARKELEEQAAEVGVAQQALGTREQFLKAQENALGDQRAALEQQGKALEDQRRAFAAQLAAAGIKSEAPDLSLETASPGKPAAKRS